MGLMKNGKDMDPRKDLPFAVSRNDTRTLVEQVTDGLCGAIKSGHFRAGDVLPGSRELADALGVSRIVTLAALRKLTEDGLVDARPRIGSVVKDRGEKTWKGRVLLVCPDGDDCFFQNLFAGALRDRLADAGYLFSEVVVVEGANGRYDFTRLDAALTMKADLVVCLYVRPEIFRYLAKRKVPYAVFGEVVKAPAGAVGSVQFDYNGAVSDFVNACAAAKVREVVEVYWHDLMCDAVGALKAAGLRASTLDAAPDFRDGRIIGVQRAGLALFERLIKSKKLKKGAVYFFADDFLAVGALAALSYHGLKAPEDVKVVTWANRELGPVYPRDLTRMEMDEIGAGRTAAAAVVDYLRTGVFPKGVKVSPRWIPGETLM